LQDTDLVTQCEDFQFQGGTGPEQGSQSSEQWQNQEHRTGIAGRRATPIISKRSEFAVWTGFEPLIAAVPSPGETNWIR